MFSIHRGTRQDAERIAALAIQVFLDTYATEGVRRDLAAEAFAEYGTSQFEFRLIEPDRVFLLAEREGGLIGFAEVLATERPAPGTSRSGAELVRLYVQPQAQGQGVGKQLIQQAENVAASRGCPGLWLAAWEHNTRALAFYAHVGYSDIGSTEVVIQHQPYGNRVLYRPASAA